MYVNDVCVCACVSIGDEVGICRYKTHTHTRAHTHTQDACNVGDEGGFAPNIQDNKEGLQLLVEVSCVCVSVCVCLCVCTRVTHKRGGCPTAC